MPRCLTKRHPYGSHALTASPCRYGRVSNEGVKAPGFRHSSHKLFRSVGLRACTSVWGTAHSRSRGDSYATFALFPVIYSGYRAVCTPTRTVSAPRERSRRKGFMTFAKLALPVPSGHVDEAYKAFGLKAGALIFQEAFSPCESNISRAHGLPWFFPSPLRTGRIIKKNN
ncbi:hypothetical protein EVAR_87492_1 [Eumeta japonica]|uniref:Uncharacterized protein n=1 Tax=Eumeta variegata TaxID=151549 RepID=A0A4C1W0I3_EUMVA|nr:hypothetical protein EVAR_87492_1 [Eumeta japonica]